MISTFGKKYFIIYWMVWAMVIIAHIFIFSFVYKLDVTLSVADGFIFNGIFALLGTGLAFMMRFADLSGRRFIEHFFYHLTGAAVTLMAWIASGDAILKIIFAQEQGYLTFLEEARTFRIIEGIFFYLTLVMVNNFLIKVTELRQQRNKEEELRDLLKETELNALRSQIRPHFLFNSLNSISSLTITDPDLARDMVIKLADFMRYSLNIADKPMSTVEKELHHTNLYIEIEKVRFSDRLKVHVDLEEGLENMSMPSMILQPLVENAIKYGVYEAVDAVMIKLRIFKDNDHVVMELTNPIEKGSLKIKGTGTGLKNIRARLLNIYKRDDLLETFIIDNHFHAELKIPEYENR